MAFTSCAHAGQHRASHSEEAEHVGIELRANFRLLAFFYGRLIAVAGVVDQHIDASEFRFGGGDSRGDLRRIRHVEIECQRAVAGSFDQGSEPCLVARSDHCAPAAREHECGEFMAEAGGASSDEPDGGIFRKGCHSMSFNAGFAPQLPRVGWNADARCAAWQSDSAPFLCCRSSQPIPQTRSARRRWHRSPPGTPRLLPDVRRSAWPGRPGSSLCSRASPTAPKSLAPATHG